MHLEVHIHNNDLAVHRLPRRVFFCFFFFITRVNVRRRCSAAAHVYANYYIVSRSPDTITERFFYNIACSVRRTDEK